MAMNAKQLVAVTSASSLLCGLLGGVLGAWLVSGSGGDVTFKTVTITDGLLVKADDSEGPGCKLLPDGTATLTGGLIAHQVRGQVFSGQTFFASTNPVNATLGDQQVMAQMTADPNTGGQLIARSREATLVPAKGQVARGNMAVIAFSPQNGKAEIFTQDLTDPKTGRAYMMAVSQKPQPQQAAANGSHPAEGPASTAPSPEEQASAAQNASTSRQTQPHQTASRPTPSDPAGRR